MARTLATNLQNALDDPFLLPVIFVDLGFDDGTLYVHTDLGDIAFGGHTYLGVGTLGDIDGLAEIEDGTPSGLTLRLSGIDTALLNEALTQNYFERPVTLYVGTRDTVTGAMVATPNMIGVGNMDQMRVMSGGPTATIEIAVESEMIVWDRSADLYFSDTDLQKVYPGDLGAKYVGAMVNNRIVVGNQTLRSVTAVLPDQSR